MGVPRILPGGKHFFCRPPPPHLNLDPDPDPHKDFEQDPDPAPEPHQNNADPQTWAQLSKDCCVRYCQSDEITHPVLYGGLGISNWLFLIQKITGSGSALIKIAGSGSALKLMRIRNTDSRSYYFCPVPLTRR